jgi:membrane protein required for colicin V production
MDQLSWVDWALLAVLLLSVLIGLWRGFVLEVLSLAGWVVAYFVAQWLAPSWAPRLPVGAPQSSVNFAAAFALAFIATLVLWSLVSRLVHLLVNATPLRGLDRVLGAVFGALRGLVMLFAVATVVALTPAAASPMWHGSVGARWLAEGLRQLKPWLPPDIVHYLPA